MEGFKSLLFSALVLAMLASSSLAIPAMGPSYGVRPGYHMSAEAQQFLGEIQEQNNMANDPEYASLQLSLLPPFAFCYQSLYILAFTSGSKNAGSDDDAYVEMRLKSGETRLIRLYDRPGDDYARYKGDLWKISLSSFRFNDRCITRSDIENVALVEGGHDGWNIDSVVTFLKRGSYYRLLSRDFNVYRWLDGNGQLSHLRFDLTLV